MIESIMFFGGGFLVASLLALILISFVHHRAVRLTRRRLEDAIPVSMSEIQAEKDLLRAEFAVSTRRLEMSVEQLKARATAQLGEIARKAEATNRLKAELSAKIAAADELDATARSLGARLHDMEQIHAGKVAALEATERALAGKEVELATALRELTERRLETDTQRVEIAVLKTQVEQFKSQGEELQQDARDAARRLFDERVAASTAAKELEEKRQAVDMLRPQVARLERELAAHALDLEGRAQRIADLERRDAEWRGQVAERDAANQALRREAMANQERHDAVAGGLQGEKATLERRMEVTTTALAAHAARIAEFEGQMAERDQLLQRRDAELSALRLDLAALKAAAAADAQQWPTENARLPGHARDAQGIRGDAQLELSALKTEEATAKAERAENALLRDRISEIAAQVAHMTMASKMPGSPIDTTPNETASLPSEALDRGPNRDGPGSRDGSLAERIRSLQTRASRISTAS